MVLHDKFLPLSNKNIFVTSSSDLLNMASSYAGDIKEVFSLYFLLSRLNSLFETPAETHFCDILNSA